MRSVVTHDRIEVYTHIPGWRGEQCVLVFSLLNGEWHTSSSMCFPSEISQARVIMDAYNIGFAELNEIIKQGN